LQNYAWPFFPWCSPTNKLHSATTPLASENEKQLRTIVQVEIGFPPPSWNPRRSAFCHTSSYRWD
jgi:hypothetical protein